jgi:hypothetical protein
MLAHIEAERAEQLRIQKQNRQNNIGGRS